MEWFNSFSEKERYEPNEGIVLKWEVFHASLFFLMTTSVVVIFIFMNLSKITYSTISARNLGSHLILQLSLTETLLTWH